MDLAEKRNFNTSLICSLAFQLFQTDEAFTVYGRKHTYTQGRIKISSSFKILTFNLKLFDSKRQFLVFTQIVTAKFPPD